MTLQQAIGAAAVTLLAAGLAPTRSVADSTPWHITGTMSEACSCSVPCTCNFGQSPSPHGFCWAIVGMTIDKGTYGETPLDGLHIACANGAKGFVFYYDQGATPEQIRAVKGIANAILTKALKANGIDDPKKAPPEMRLVGVFPAQLAHQSGDGANHVLIADRGRFDSRYLVGIDGKTPVTIDNNWSINIHNNIKAKTTVMRYHDPFGNRFDFKDTNSNQGQFDWTDTTPVYFR